MKPKGTFQTIAILFLLAVWSVSYVPQTVIAGRDRPATDSTMPSDTIRSIDDAFRIAGVERDPAVQHAPYGMFARMEPRWDSTPGSVDLVLTVANLVDDGCTSFEVRVFEVDGLRVLSPLPLRFELMPGDTEIVEVSVDVPACDTSRICLLTGCGRRNLFQNASFLADSSFVEYRPLWTHDRPPRPGMGAVQLPHDSRYRQRMMDSLREIGPITRHYVTGKDGKEYNVDSLPADFEPLTPGWKKRHDTPQAVGDSVPAWGMNDQGEWVLVSRDSVNQAWERERIDRRLREMEERQNVPCSVSSERMTIGGQVYSRNRGETEFRLQHPITDIPAYIDSVFRKQPDGEGLTYDIIVDLSDPIDSVFVQGLADSLRPIEPAHHYRIELERNDVPKLEQSTVPWNYYPLMPGERLEVPKRPPSPSSGPVPHSLLWDQSDNGTITRQVYPLVPTIKLTQNPCDLVI